MVNNNGSDLKAICIILMLLAVGANWQYADAGVTDGLTEGLKFAGQMFGINTAADVADLVAKAFSNAATTTTTAQAKPDLFSTFFQQNKKPTTFPDSSEDGQQEESSQHAEQDSSSDEKYKKESVKLDFSSAKLITGVLRMIGFDARKLGALALNAIVMMAQAIGHTLLGAFSKKNTAVSTIDGGGRLFMGAQNTQPNGNDDDESTQSDNEEYRPRQLRSGSPIDWYLKDPTDEMKTLLANAMDEKLTDYLVDMIEDVENTIPGGENKAVCVKMLMCKCSPFIWGMQKSLEKRLNGTMEEDREHQRNENSIIDKSVFYRHLPSLEEFRKHSSICEQRYGDLCKPMDILKEK